MNKGFKVGVGLLFCFFLSSHSTFSQNDLGEVWTKEYKLAPNGIPYSLTAQPLYTEANRYLITGTNGPRIGFIAMIDESGNLIKEWQIPIPSYYDKYVVRHADFESNDAGFTSYYKNLGITGTPPDILYSTINTAVLKEDGSILAFGTVYRYRADAWSVGTPDYSPGSSSFLRMVQGVWKIRIDKEGNIIENTTARGCDAISLIVYNDKFLLSGIDIHEPANVGNLGTKGRGQGMLHEYDLNGNFIAERCPPEKDADPITGARRTPDGNILLDGWASNSVLVDGNNYSIIGQFNSTVISANATSYPMAGSGTIDGGFFFNPQFGTGYAPRGASFGKLRNDGTLAYKVLDSENDRSTIYNNPFVLDFVEHTYVGSVYTAGVSKIYKLKDKITSFELEIGDPYPKNTTLRDVSLSDGFFAMSGSSTAPGTRSFFVSKLSTCANFKLNVGETNTYVPSGKAFAGRTITHTGNETNGDVSYTWTLKDISVGGNAIQNLGVTSGNTNVLPNQTFSLLPDKNIGILEYEITATDKYLNNGVSQSCSQTYTITVTVSSPTSTLFNDDVWYFSNNKGVPRANGTDQRNPFTSKAIIFKTDANGNKVPTVPTKSSMVNSWENSLSVSTPACEGGVIFYAQHNKVFNTEHEKMLGGDFLGDHSSADGLAAAYIGDNKYIFLAISTTIPASNPEINSYMIDMAGDNGKGSMTPKGRVGTDVNVGESLELIPKVGTYDEYWLMYFTRDYKIKTKHVKGDVITTVGTDVQLAPMDLGYIFESYKFVSNSTYTKLALTGEYNHPTNPVTYKGRVYLFDFDPLTGILTFDKIIEESGNTYGVAFSPSGEFLYISHYNVVYYNAYNNNITQYNVKTGAIVGTSPFLPSATILTPAGGGMKLGPDGKIYIIREGSENIPVIHRPDEAFSLTNQVDTASFKLIDANGVKYDGNGLSFSTGLTYPWINPPSANKTPIAKPDAVLTYPGLKVKLKPLDNDNDPDAGDNLIIKSVEYTNKADEGRLSKTINEATKEVEFTFVAGYIPTQDTTINFIYVLKDDGVPVQLCDEAGIKIFIKSIPNIIIKDSCSFAPKLVADIVNNSYTVIWEVAKVAAPDPANATDWDVVTGVNGKMLELKGSLDKEYIYRYKLKNAEGESYYSAPLKIAVETYMVSGNIWYKVSKK